MDKYSSLINKEEVVLTKKELAIELKKVKKIAYEEKCINEKLKRNKLKILLKDLDNIMYAVIYKEYIENDNVQKRMIEKAKDCREIMKEKIYLNSGPINLAIQNIVELISNQTRVNVLRGIIFKNVYDLRDFTVKEKIEKEFERKYGLQCILDLSIQYTCIDITIFLFRNNESKTCIIS